MDTKKTILVSVLSTLATLFVVAVIIHMCHGHCGQNSCAKAKSCHATSYGNNGGHGHGHGCAEGNSCAGQKAKCHKKRSCSSKSSCSADDTHTSVTYTKDGDKKIIKKIVKKETQE